MKTHWEVGLLPYLWEIDLPICYSCFRDGMGDQMQKDLMEPGVTNWKVQVSLKCFPLKHLEWSKSFIDVLPRGTDTKINSGSWNISSWKGPILKLNHPAKSAVHIFLELWQIWCQDHFPAEPSNWPPSQRRTWKCLLSWWKTFESCGMRIWFDPLCFLKAYE